VYIQELAKRLVHEGHYVTVFCGNDGKSLRNEVIDGVRVVRRGGFYFVYVWAFFYYIFRFRKKYDVVIDCHNGVPFFTPLYVREPVYCLMHHVHQEVFRRSLSKPLAAFARFLEKDLMPRVYRNIPFITISESSKEGIEKLGLGNAGVQIVHPGVDLGRLSLGEKSAHPSVLYLGRLKAYKSVDVLLRAFSLIFSRMPDAQLVIAGAGEEEKRLKKLARELGIASAIDFRGKVSDEEKVRLMQRAWVFVNPSFMEGWGITTIEANACGTPVVASNVPGLRDSVQNPHTGYLVPYGDVDVLAERVLFLLANTGQRNRMGREAMLWAKNFDWDALSQSFLSFIRKRST
jgi:glycosyltransferase involved in cell wall biosynthesis